MDAVIRSYLDVHESSHSASSVNRFLLSTPVLDFWRSDIVADVSSGELFETVFPLLERTGGLSQATPPRRCAPSAGSCYPIDVLVLSRDNGQPVAMLHHPESHRLLQLRPDTAARLVRPHRLAAGAVLVLVVAVFWRTVERYGARGSRYCLIETGHVVSNLVETLRDRDCQTEVDLPVLCGPGADVRQGAAAIASVMLRRGETQALAGSDQDERRERLSLTPWYSENAIRTERFYFEARQVVGGQPLDSLSVTRQQRRGVPWQALRRSCKGFMGQILPTSSIHRLEAFLHELSAVARTTAITFSLLSSGGEDKFAMLWSSAPQRANILEVSRRALFDACNRQSIVADCAALLILSMSAPDAGAESLAQYYRALIEVGVLSADIHRFCSLQNVGTSMVCGFHDLDLASAVHGHGGRPLAVHVFGIPDSRGSKSDLAYHVANGPRISAADGERNGRRC